MPSLLRDRIRLRASLPPFPPSLCDHAQVTTSGKRFVENLPASESFPLSVSPHGDVAAAHGHCLWEFPLQVSVTTAWGRVDLDPLRSGVRRSLLAILRLLSRKRVGRGVCCMFAPPPSPFSPTSWSSLVMGFPMHRAGVCSRPASNVSVSAGSHGDVPFASSLVLVNWLFTGAGVRDSIRVASLLAREDLDAFC